MSRVSGNEGISARLTADIDLNNENWAGNEFGGTSGYGTGYHGTFDGDGHTISGYYYEVSLKTNSLYHMGMFGYVVKGTVKNLTLDGQMVLDASQATEKLSRYYMGGVISEVDGGTIENVINDVDITVKNDTNGYARGKVGGVVADASICSEKDPNGGDPTITNTVVNNCENRGSISGSGYARRCLPEAWSWCDDQKLYQYGNGYFLWIRRWNSRKRRRRYGREFCEYWKYFW